MATIGSDPSTTAYAYIGIAVGFVVFAATLGAVFMLLYFGGSFDRMKHEASGMPTSADQVKPLLYDDLLQKAASLPLKPAAYSLDGQFVHIRPLESFSDRKAIVSTLHEISSGKAISGIYGGKAFDADAALWRYMLSGPYETVGDFERGRCIEADNQRLFVLLDASTSKPIGMVGLLNHSPTDLRVEIGAIWLVPAFQGTGVHREVVYLLLDVLFREGGYRRVEWRCDGFNVRSRKAAHSLGFTMEGVLRKHMIAKGANRDTVVFAALNGEWPAIQEMLQAKLNAMLAKRPHKPKDD
ncbi:hypothetical protein DYB25_012233 [Aphanomyces astaci]|uniref:N-acetyltransferase domain-containing protein n=1 Tax=Aphanomyces astaci TaxID=112090 RepID=A0A397A714_APHAT|nr:hypothetical protein DYB25_012233 [Aphanomyces astaci]RHY40094.1 hypothetical protein DYB30_007123 [Aphanomyces astaci]RHY42872.1 hypothetical protein DYB34_012014 [Aphanomyces astaci]RHY58827.1 hypothetical protein DYB38_010034 [Aphanomyces astaci]RHY85676.1 hypothetical protein DYB26_016186 [Aphanomyces astaci]